MGTTITSVTDRTAMERQQADGFDGSYRRVTEIDWIDCIICNSPLRNNRTTGICSHFGHADYLLIGQ
ncbi:MAG: hypothetical protein GY758_22215 [Fuerstiella sp.]|nr:hypothetical protein [Fuerstiella sp.]MCP4785630.1 hypothetical protein [Fuerstiella sp.]MCP4856555.1 hypothetical protein [Fuerstiella sp.]